MARSRATPGLNSVYHPHQLIHRWPVMGGGASVLILDHAFWVDDEIAAQLAQVAAAKVVQAALGQKLDVGQDCLEAKNLAQKAALKPVCPINIQFLVRKQWKR